MFAETFETDLFSLFVKCFVTVCSCHAWCGQVIALAEKSYAEFIDTCTTVTFAAAVLCACVLVTIFLLPVIAPRNCPGMFFNTLIISAIALVTLTGLIWIGQTATWHRDAADDLMHQVLRCASLRFVVLHCDS